MVGSRHMIFAFILFTFFSMPAHARFQGCPLWLNSAIVETPFEPFPFDYDWLPPGISREGLTQVTSYQGAKQTLIHLPLPSLPIHAFIARRNAAIVLFGALRRRGMTVNGYETADGSYAFEGHEAAGVLVISLPHNGALFRTHRPNNIAREDWFPNYNSSLATRLTR